jgi:hypothetical protein
MEAIHIAVTAVGLLALGIGFFLWYSIKFCLDQFQETYRLLLQQQDDILDNRVRAKTSEHLIDQFIKKSQRLEIRIGTLESSVLGSQLGERVSALEMKDVFKNG